MGLFAGGVGGGGGEVEQATLNYDETCKLLCFLRTKNIRNFPVRRKGGPDKFLPLWFLWKNPSIKDAAKYRL